MNIRRKEERESLKMIINTNPLKSICGCCGEEKVGSGFEKECPRKCGAGAIYTSKPKTVDDWIKEIENSN